MAEDAAREVYRAIIDELVGQVPSVAERLLTEEALYSRAVGDEAINDFARSLTDDQRVTLAEVCRRERMSGIHDVLALLTWWIDCRELTLALAGKELPVDESGTGLHGDFIGRLDGWSWPSG